MSVVRHPAKPLEGWRRRPNVRYEGVETSGAGWGDEPTPRWHLWGEHVEDDLQRIRQGLICIRCYQPFPLPLSRATRRLILEECAPFGRPIHEVALLIDASHCPFCTAEVSPEIAAVFLKGYMTRSVEAPAELEPGDHEGYEKLLELDSKSKLFLPKGWGRQ